MCVCFTDHIPVHVDIATRMISDVFQRLFRQDLLVASLFRNFLLAERIMKSYDCNPVSHPFLPSTHKVN